MEVKKITAFDRLDFRKWLEKNHDKEKKVAVVVYKKHTGKASPSHKELMEEAICFGWIDTTINRLDDTKYIRHFTKRSKNSKWSDNTISYARDLIKRKKMTPAGLKIYKEGLKKPTHDYGIPKNPDMPDELKKALENEKNSLENFKKFSPSVKRTFYRWILSAKLSETKIKRIDKTVELAKENKKLY